MTNQTETNQTPVFIDDEPSFDFRQYLGLLRQWWWLMILVAALFGGAAFLLSRWQTPIYRSSTTLLINEAPSTTTANYTSIITSERLAQTYAQLITKRSVMLGVIDALGIKTSPEALQGMVSVTPVSDTQLLVVSVESQDPRLAAAIANSTATIFAEQVRETQRSRFAASMDNLKAQMADNENQILQIKQSLENAQDQTEKDRLENRLNQYEQIYANLVVSYEEVRLAEAQTASTVTQVEEAVVNFTPVKPNTTRNTLLATMMGLMLAVGGVFMYDALDDTIKSPEDLRRRLNLPVMGAIPRFEENEDERLIAQAQPRSPVTESFRALRTNIQYAFVDSPLRTLMVTSPAPSDGKTTIISNLAVVMSRSGKRVTVVDGDMHRPQVHSMFSTKFRPGLSEMFVGPLHHLNGTFQPTMMDGLHVVSAGKLPPNPSELLGSKTMQEILSLVLDNSDLVLVDTPPILSVTDALVLAPILDGVLVVVKPGKTKFSMLQSTVEQLRHVGARVIGVVINGIDERNVRYGYYYKSYQYKTYKNYGEEKPVKGKAKGKASKQHSQAEPVEAADVETVVEE